jgi:fatty acid-binding protein DegV
MAEINNNGSTTTNQPPLRAAKKVQREAEVLQHNDLAPIILNAAISLTWNSATLIE